MTTELGEREGEPLVNRLREWLKGARMDIHVLRLREYPAAKYAIAHAKGDDYKAFLESVDAWASNLRDQGYIRVVAVLISFQWSNPALGPPWDRTEESKPPQRTAWKEIEAAFLAERLSRSPDLREILNRSWLRCTGPIALFDARALGSNLPASAKATPLGQALTIECPLDPVEREILLRSERQIAIPELIKMFRAMNCGEESVYAAITSLLRRRLVSIEQEQQPASA
jgi:hypothetical protein